MDNPLIELTCVQMDNPLIHVELTSCPKSRQPVRGFGISDLKELKTETIIEQHL